MAHEAEMPKYLGDVRCWVNSGSHLLALSISEFDPTRTDGRRLLRRPMARRLLRLFRPI